MLKTIKLKTIIILDIYLILYFAIFPIKRVFQLDDFYGIGYDKYETLSENGSIIVMLSNTFDDLFLVNGILIFILLIFTILEFRKRSDDKIKKLLKIFIITLSLIILYWIISFATFSGV